MLGSVDGDAAGTLAVGSDVASAVGTALGDALAVGEGGGAEVHDTATNRARRAAGRARVIGRMDAPS
jgi:hypothetical protein